MSYYERNRRLIHAYYNDGLNWPRNLEFDEKHLLINDTGCMYLNAISCAFKERKTSDDISLALSLVGLFKTSIRVNFGLNKIELVLCKYEKTEEIFTLDEYQNITETSKKSDFSRSGDWSCTFKCDDSFEIKIYRQLCTPGSPYTDVGMYIIKERLGGAPAGKTSELEISTVPKPIQRCLSRIDKILSLYNSGI